MNVIKCQKCGTDIEIDKALEGQIESRLLTQINEKHQAELLKVRSEAESVAEKLLNEQVKLKVEQHKKKSGLEVEKLKAQLEHKAEQNNQKNELLIERLSNEAADSKKTNEELRAELKKLTEAMLKER